MAGGSFNVKPPVYPEGKFTFIYCVQQLSDPFHFDPPGGWQDGADCDVNTLARQAVRRRREGGFRGRCAIASAGGGNGQKEPACRAKAPGATADPAHLVKVSKGQSR